jgi:phage pi2 protein 07
MALKNPLVVTAAASKAGKKATKAAKKIDGNTNNALSWIAVIAAGGFVYYMFRQFQKFSDLQDKVAENVQNAFNNITEGLTDSAGGGVIIDPNLGVPNISEMTAQSLATQLYEAMKYWGTDFERIKNALNGLTPADFHLVGQKFGLVRYGFGGRENWPFPKKNLLQWILEEVSNNQLNELKTLHPNIFGKAEEQPLKPGDTVYSKGTTPVYKAQLIDGVWHKKEFIEDYATDELIGDIMLIKQDPWQSSLQYAIIDKPWSWTELWVETKYLKK